MKTAQQWVDEWCHPTSLMYDADAIRAIQIDALEAAQDAVYQGDARRYDLSVCDEISGRIVLLKRQVEAK